MSQITTDQTNLENQQRWGEAVMSGNLDAFDELVAANVVDHDAAPGQGPGPGGFKTFFGMLRTAFPDIKITAEKLIEFDDQIALAYTIEGTHRGPFLDIAPTGKRIKARGVQIARYENGKLVERWGSSDELGILKQIGAKIGS